MTKIKVKSVIEFLFWIVLFVLALAYFNKSWNLPVYFVIGAFLFVLLIIEVVLSLEYQHRGNTKKKIKINIKQNKKIFYKELTSLFSFVSVLIVIFSLIVQKNKFIDFLSFKHSHLYVILVLVIVALVIIILQFIEHAQTKKKEKAGFIMRIKYDFIFLFGLMVVIFAYLFRNWITALLGLILMMISLVAYHLTSKKRKAKEKIITKPKKIIKKKIPKEQKLKLLLEGPAGALTEIKKKEKKAKEEERIERLKLRELQKKIREEEKRRKKEINLKQRQKRMNRLREFFRQKMVEREKKRLERIEKAKEKILVKEEKLGKTMQNREEIEKMIKMKKSLKPEARYETDFDRLLVLIKKYERLKLSDVAKIFGVSLKKAEEWATILEQSKLLDIHYPAIGEPELKIKK